VTALRARDEGRPPLVFQLLVYPPTNLSSFETTSHTQLADRFVVARSAMELNRRRYLPDPAQRTHPYASPLLADDLTRLPPALVITAQFDPLRDEGEAYARRLREAGVPVTACRYDGVVHGFFGVQILRKGRAAIDDAALALRRAFAR
jgi:acetyl esterase